MDFSNCSKMEREAHKLIAQGFAIIPLAPHGKKPLTSHGLNQWTKSDAVVAGWFDRWPDANIGIVCGVPSGGLVVLDVDTHDEDASGMDRLILWEALHGKLPETASAITGSGGVHYLFRTGVRIAPSVNREIGIDVRGEGSYIVAPPSVHPNGRRYEWEVSPDEIDIAQADARVLEFIDYVQPHANKTGERFTLPAIIVEGERNDVLFRCGASLRAKSVDPDTIAASLVGINAARCRPSLPVEEVETIIDSVLKLPAGHSAEFDRDHGSDGDGHFEEWCRNEGC